MASHFANNYILKIYVTDKINLNWAIKIITEINKLMSFQHQSRLPAENL